jgi:hypothetical protein
MGRTGGQPRFLSTKRGGCPHVSDHEKLAVGPFLCSIGKPFLRPDLALSSPPQTFQKSVIILQPPRRGFSVGGGVLCLVLRHDVTGEDLGSVECQEITLDMICASVLKIQRWWDPVDLARSPRG